MIYSKGNPKIRKKAFKGMAELPVKPHPPKYWKPTPEEIERNSLLRETMKGDDNK